MPLSGHRSLLLLLMAYTVCDCSDLCVDLNILSSKTVADSKVNLTFALQPTGDCPDRMYPPKAINFVHISYKLDFCLFGYDNETTLWGKVRGQKENCKCPNTDNHTCSVKGTIDKGWNVTVTMNNGFKESHSILASKPRVKNLTLIDEISTTTTTSTTTTMQQNHLFTLQPPITPTAATATDGDTAPTTTAAAAANAAADSSADADSTVVDVDSTVTISCSWSEGLPPRDAQLTLNDLDLNATEEPASSHRRDGRLRHKYYVIPHVRCEDSGRVECRVPGAEVNMTRKLVVNCPHSSTEDSRMTSSKASPTSAVPPHSSSSLPVVPVQLYVTLGVSVPCVVTLIVVIAIVCRLKKTLTEMSQRQRIRRRSRRRESRPDQAAIPEMWYRRSNVSITITNDLYETSDVMDNRNAFRLPEVPDNHSKKASKPADDVTLAKGDDVKRSRSRDVPSDPKPRQPHSKTNRNRNHDHKPDLYIGSTVTGRVDRYGYSELRGVGKKRAAIDAAPATAVAAVASSSSAAFLNRDGDDDVMGAVGGGILLPCEGPATEEERVYEEIQDVCQSDRTVDVKAPLSAGQAEDSPEGPELYVPLTKIKKRREEQRRRRTTGNPIQELVDLFAPLSDDSQDGCHENKDLQSVEPWSSSQREQTEEAPRRLPRP